MAKDTLKQLDRDVDRMLFAGAQIARTDHSLAEAKERLSPLAARAPALAKVTDQIDKLQQATGKAAATELLALAALMAQVRGAQATPALPEVTGDLTPLPPARKISTPLSPTELGTLVGALTNAPELRHRPRIITDYVERGAARDLRIIPLVVPALADTNIAQAVLQSLIPALGDAIVPELRKKLDITGGNSFNVRILQAITRLEGKEATPMLLEAIEKGAAEIRAAALEELGKIDPEAAEPIATTIANKDRSKLSRAAACAALANATGDAALEALLRAFDPGVPSEVRAAAESSLAASKHPEATARIIARLTPELRSLGHFRIQKANTKEEKEAAAKAKKAHAAQVDYACDLVSLIATRGTEEGTNLTLDLFRTHKVKEIRDAAARALLRIGYPGAWDELMPSLYDASEDTRVDFVDGIFAFSPAKAYDILSRFLEPAAVARKNGAELATMILVHVTGNHLHDTDPDAVFSPSEEIVRDGRMVRQDPRWSALATGLLSNPKLRDAALAVLVLAPLPEVLGEALSLSREENLTSHNALGLMELLAKYRDPRILPSFIRLLPPLRGTFDYGRAAAIFTEYDDPAFSPYLRTWLHDKNEKKRMPKAENDIFVECLRFLDRSREPASASN